MNYFEQVANHCRFLLNNFHNADNALQYLNTRLSKESQEKFNFGYFPNSENLEVMMSVVNKNVLKKLSLSYDREIFDSLSYRCVPTSYFEYHPIVIPYKDVYGNVIALIGRSLLNDSDRKKIEISKYKNTIFKKGNHLFGLYEAKASILDQDVAYVVEGQFDVIKAHEKGLTNVVALSNSSMTAYQFTLLLRYTKNIFLVLDNDESGLRGRKKIIDKFDKYANIKNLYIHEPYKDMDEYFSSTNEISFVTK